MKLRKLIIILPILFSSTVIADTCQKTIPHITDDIKSNGCLTCTKSKLNGKTVENNCTFYNPRNCCSNDSCDDEQQFHEFFLGHCGKSWDDR